MKSFVKITEETSLLSLNKKLVEIYSIGCQTERKRNSSCSTQTRSVSLFVVSSDVLIDLLFSFAFLCRKESKSVCSEHSSLANNGLSNVLSSGSLEVRLKLDAKSSKMWVFILKANIELMQRSTKPSFVQIHLTVLPNKKIRYRTRPKPIENALFTEEFFCKVATGFLETKFLLSNANKRSISFGFSLRPRND